MGLDATFCEHGWVTSGAGYLFGRVGSSFPWMPGERHRLRWERTGNWMGELKSQPAQNSELLAMQLEFPLSTTPLCLLNHSKCCMGDAHSKPNRSTFWSPVWAPLRSEMGRAPSTATAVAGEALPQYLINLSWALTSDDR